MSRCFPYPPPGYGAAHDALIESIKLQKETDKAKAERRKEKRAKKEKEKKKEEKEKRKNDGILKLQKDQSQDSDEKLKLQKDQSQDSHNLQKEAEFTDAQIKGKKTSTEKSDVTEEHGQPIKPCYSSDSTQNSNKRRRDDDDDVLLPDDSSGHGKHIKIRLLKKHKGSDSSNSGEDARLKTVPLVPSSNLDRPLLVSSNQNIGVPATSGRENSAIQGIPLIQTKSNASFDRTKDSNPNRFRLGREQFALGSSAKQLLPSGSRKSDVEVLKSSRQQLQQQQQQQRRHQQIASFVRPVVPQAQSHLKHEIPSSSVSRNTGVHGLNLVRHQQGPSNLKPAIPNPITIGKRPIDEVTVDPTTRGKRPIDEVTVVPTTRGKRPIVEIAVPGNSGPTKLEKKSEHPKKVGPSRSEKKRLKKHAKYEKLIGSWVPPVFQAPLPVVDDADEDWLSRTKPAVSSISRVEIESCRELAATSLWQPRARYLEEADIHALPYAVPF